MDKNKEFKAGEMTVSVYDGATRLLSGCGKERNEGVWDVVIGLPLEDGAYQRCREQVYLLIDAIAGNLAKRHGAQFDEDYKFDNGVEERALPVHKKGRTITREMVEDCIEQAVGRFNRAVYPNVQKATTSTSALSAAAQR